MRSGSSVTPRPVAAMPSLKSAPGDVRVGYRFAADLAFELARRGHFEDVRRRQ